MQINRSTFRTPTLNRVASKSGRLYELPDGRQVPGVTTVLEAINKPALVHWAASEERKHCLEVATQTFTSLAGDDGASQFMTADNFRALLTENLGKSKAHSRVMKKAADIGTETHAAIERWIRESLGQSVGPMPQLSEPALLAYMAFEDWAKAVKFQPLAAEVMVYDPWQNYAGTLDYIARINGILTVGDWKTGKAIYREAFLQNAAYISALRKQCQLGDEPIQGAICRFPKSLDDVKEQPFEVKVIPHEEQRDIFIAFLKTLDLWKWLHPEVSSLAVRHQPRSPSPPTPKPWVRPAGGRPVSQRWPAPARR